MYLKEPDNEEKTHQDWPRGLEPSAELNTLFLFFQYSIARPDAKSESRKDGEILKGP